MTMYTLVEHSGLGRQGVEPRAVTRSSDESAVLKAGGVLLSYGVADDLADAVLQYSGPQAICPSSVAGTFSPSTFRGLALWLPDSRALTVLRIGDECSWRRPMSELVQLADAILSPAA
jgi:hypothetical protein